MNNHQSASTTSAGSTQVTVLVSINTFSKSQKKVSQLKRGAMQKTILYIEDDPCLRVDLEEELRIAGYEVLTACNGREGLEMISAKPSDLILTDVSMPIMNGYELLTILRGSEYAYLQAPVIFMTAHDEAETSKKCSSRPDAVLQKPVDFEELIQTMRRMLGQA